jgi:hypothetical protein
VYVNETLAALQGITGSGSDDFWHSRVGAWDGAKLPRSRDGIFETGRFRLKSISNLISLTGAQHYAALG